MISKFIGLSGMIRGGATLLSAILDQNPAIHAEGNSAVCQLMWDMQQSCYGAANEQLNGAYRLHTTDDLVASIPNVYYKDISASIVMDKCRTWTLPDNMDMLKRYFKNSPKVIVLERPIIDVIKSLVAQKRRSGNSTFEMLENFTKGIDKWLIPPLTGLNWARQNNNGEFLFIKYDDLVDNPQDVLDSIYSFCGIKPFKHDLASIKNNHPDNDELFFKNAGLHDVRPTIRRRKIDVELSDEVIYRCAVLQQSILESSNSHLRLL